MSNDNSNITITLNEYLYLLVRNEELEKIDDILWSLPSDSTPWDRDDILGKNHELYMKEFKQNLYDEYNYNP